MKQNRVAFPSGAIAERDVNVLRARQALDAAIASGLTFRMQLDCMDNRREPSESDQYYVVIRGAE